MKILLGLLMATFLAGGLEAEDRFALVIGNGDYKTLSKLTTADRDASGVADTLRRLGFKVDQLTNASLKDIGQAVERLRVKLSKSTKSYGFVYYSGLAIQDKGQNYLIPADADIAAGPELPDRAVTVQSLLDTIDVAGNIFNVVVLDACGPNPFRWSTGATEGLAEPTYQPKGSLIVYPTAARSSVAPDHSSTFAQELQQSLVIPGLSIQEALNWTTANVRTATDGQQVPAVFDRLAQKFFLAGTGPGDTPAGLLGPSRTSNQKLGTTGPGGGIIFYNKGNNDNGWQYLEVAQADLPAIAWSNGKDGVATGAGDTAVGTGKTNTAKIINALGQGQFAASVCANYAGGGLQDWFLPSKEELDLVIKVLKLRPAFATLSDFYYWSSTERSPSEAWNQETRKNAQHYNLKGFAHLVRPIRSF